MDYDFSVKHDINNGQGFGRELTIESSPTTNVNDPIDMELQLKSVSISAIDDRILQLQNEIEVIRVENHEVAVLDPKAHYEMKES